MRKQKKKDLFLHFNAQQMKWLCFVFVFLYTFSYAILQNGILKVYQYDFEQLSTLLKDPSVMNITTFSQVLVLLVGVALPIYAMLLVEGFQHTRNVWKYALRLFLLALVCEIPFDMCMYHRFFYKNGQNPVFSLLVCLILLIGFDMLEGISKGFRILFKIVITVSAICWTILIRSEFGLALVLMCVIYYQLQDKKILKHILAGMVGALYITGPFAAYLAIGYDGQKGLSKYPYLFYVLYFAHLLILGVLSYLL